MIAYLYQLIALDKPENRSYQVIMTWDEEIDATGLLCPLPVLKARKRLKGMAAGNVLRLLTNDPAAAIDVPHYCAESGNDLVGTAATGQTTAFLIRKTG